MAQCKLLKPDSSEGCFAQRGTLVLEAAQSQPAQWLCPRECVDPVNLGWYQGTERDYTAQVLERATPQLPRGSLSSPTAWQRGPVNLCKFTVLRSHYTWLEGANTIVNAGQSSLFCAITNSFWTVFPKQRGTKSCLFPPSWFHQCFLNLLL